MFWKKRDYMDWNTYSKKIEFMDDFQFQQQVRKQNVNNIGL